MNQCPYVPAHKLREGLPPLTPRIASLPVDERGYPVPFFVSWIDGKPEFRIADGKKLVRCVKERLCWVCGQPLGCFLTFSISPMCAINRTTAEPPEHLECAEWSVKGCPFLSNTKAKRREDEFTQSLEGNVSGEMIKRNPGVTCIWTTKSYRWFRDGRGGGLINIGDPESVSWWKEGRVANLAEVMESIRTGMPVLMECIEKEEEKYRPEALKALQDATARITPLLPTA